MTVPVLRAVIMSALVSANPAHACPRSGAQSPSGLHREWILQGWEKRAGDAPFDFQAKLGRFYDWSGDGVLLYDDLSPGRRVARNAAEYGAMWSPIFQSQREVRHAVIDGPDVIVGTGLATSTLEFAARLEASTGAITGIRDRSTLVWRCRAGTWRIAREHNSSHPVSRDEIDRLVAVR